MFISQLIIFSLLTTLAVGIPQDACKDVNVILESHGHKSYKYTLTTSDGYILTIFRVGEKIGEKNAVPLEERPPLILQHGVTASANNFVSDGDNSPAFFFFDQGFDVWLPNIRGSRYSRQHQTLDPNSKEYWDFTFEEMGTKDTKEIIKLIKDITGKKVAYLGFSQGFMQMMAAFSLDPKFFQDNLSKIVGWAPVVRVDLCMNLGALLGGFLRVAELLPWFGFTHTPEFNYDDCVAEVKDCENSPLKCKLSMMMSNDFLPSYNVASGPIYGHESTSIKDVMHFARNIAKRGFYRFRDDAQDEEYDLTKITKVPIGLFVGTVDTMSSVANAKWLEGIFTKNGNLRVLNYYDYLGHQTFIISRLHFKHYDDTAAFLKSEQH